MTLRRPGRRPAPQHPALALSCRPPLARAFRHTLLALALAGAAGAAQAADAPAAQAARSYDIPAGALGPALTRYASESGINIAIDPALVAGRTTRGLSGQFAPRDGLARLLAGSGLEGQPAGAAGYVLRATTAPDASVLPEVQVSADGLRDGKTEDTASYTGSTSATKLNLSLRETPQSVSVITRQQMDDQALNTVQDVLNQTTGISIDKSTSTQEYTQVYSRGFAVDTYMFDGIPTSSQLEGITFDTAIYDRVEVVRGATGLVSGTGSPAAAVNLVRKRPTREFSGSVAASAGSWDRYRAEADLSGSLVDNGRIRGRIVAAHQDYGSFVSRAKQKKDVFYGVIEADLTDSTLLTAGLVYQDDRMDQASRGFPLFFSDGSQTSFSRRMNGASDWSYYDRKQTSLFASLEHTFANDWIAKAVINRSENDYDALQGYAQNGYPNRDTGAGGGLWLANWHGKPKQTSVDLYATGPFTLLGRKHDLVFGVSASRYEQGGATYPNWRLPGYDASIPNIFNWNGHSPKPVFEGTETGSSKTREEELGLYATARLRPTERFSVILGGRYTDWKRDVDSNYYDGTQVSDRLREKGKITPFAGVVYDLDANWSVYASYTSIFKPQAYRDRNNSFLPPVEGDNYELGVKGEFFGGALNASAAVFELKQDNLAEKDPDNIWVTGGGGGSYAYRTVQGATARGIEMEISGELQPGWQMIAGYSYRQLKDSDGRSIDTNQPNSLFKLWTTYRLRGAWHPLTVGGGVTWQSKMVQPDYGPNDETFRQDAYALVGLMARYDFNRQLSATLNVNNLLDKKYYSTGMGGYYGDPRNAMLTMKYRF